MSYHGKAAVMVILASHSGSGLPNVDSGRILLTQRSLKMNSHRGEVALPGGKWEELDEGLLHTAFRETEEEVGIHATQLDLVGELSIASTGRGVEVKTYVALANEAVNPVICDFELASYFWLPLSVVVDDKRTETNTFNHQGKQFWAPVYEYEGYRIWGFTARTLVRFANDFYNARIEQNPSR